MRGEGGTGQLICLPPCREIRARGCRTDLTNESVLEEIKERHNVLREQMKC